MRDYYGVNEMEEMYGIKWDELAKLEPELESLLRWARMVGNSCRKWTDVERGFAQFKSDITELAGFSSRHRGHPVLATRGAYEVVYWKIHNAVARDRRAGRGRRQSFKPLLPHRLES